MDQKEVSTKGSPAPNTNAGNTSNLWEQVAARQSVQNADIQKSAQALAATEPSAPVAASAQTDAVTDTDGAVTESSRVGEVARASSGASVVGDVAGNVIDAELINDVAQNQPLSVQVNADAKSVNSVAGIGEVSTLPAAQSPDRATSLDPMDLPHPPAKAGKPIRPTLENLGAVLEGYGIHVSYDVIKKRLVVLIPDHTGSIDNHEAVALAVINSLATLNGMPIGQIPAMLIALGDRRLRNKVADWILSKPWDGIDRLPEFYATITERKGYPPQLKKILLRRWLLSAVAAVLKPHGFHCRGVLVLQGPQGIGKTQFVAALVPDAALRDQVVLLGHHLDGASKDSMTTAITHWIVELGELDGTLRKDIAKLKSFITADFDKVRRPYGRSDSEYQRRSVFIATVNASTFLVDDTGNSRFWTLAVAFINYQHGIDMQQVFAQIAVEFEAGEQWWLTQDEEMQLALVNQEHRVVSLVRERLMAAIDTEAPAGAKTQALSAIEVLQEAGLDRPTNPQCKECAAILREMYGDPKKVHGKYVWKVVLIDKGKFRFDSCRAAKPVDDDDLY